MKDKEEYNRQSVVCFQTLYPVAEELTLCGPHFHHELFGTLPRPRKIKAGRGFWIRASDATGEK